MRVCVYACMRDCVSVWVCDTNVAIKLNDNWKKTEENIRVHIYKAFLFTSKPPLNKNLTYLIRPTYLDSIKLKKLKNKKESVVYDCMTVWLYDCMTVWLSRGKWCMYVCVIFITRDNDDNDDNDDLGRSCPSSTISCIISCY